MIKLNLKFICGEHNLIQKNLGKILMYQNLQLVDGNKMPLYRMIELSNNYGYSIDFILRLSKDNSKCKTKINTTKEEIATKLKEIRTNSKLTQNALTKKYGVARTTYCNYEEGPFLINTIMCYI